MTRRKGECGVQQTNIYEHRADQVGVFCWSQAVMGGERLGARCAGGAGPTSSLVRNQGRVELSARIRHSPGTAVVSALASVLSSEICS